MSKTLISVLVWLPLFLSFELTAVFWTGCPWYTFSETFWKLIAYWHPFWYFTALFFVILIGHFGYHWSAKYLILIGALGIGGILVHTYFREAWGFQGELSRPMVPKKLKALVWLS